MIPGNIKPILDSFRPVSLDELERAALMNRIDTKFLASVSGISEFLSVMNGYFRVLEINGQRMSSYSTTYLDTPDYMFFNQHVTGRCERHKIRFRTYVSTGSSFMEIKRRTRKNRTVKWRIEKDINNGPYIEGAASDFVRNYVPDCPLCLLKPVLFNNFTRITFANNALDERITIDLDVSFADISGNCLQLPFIAIMEIKRDSITGSGYGIARVVKDLGIRPTGFSKYCTGIAYLCDPPKKNLLKPKLLHLKKIENEYYRHSCA